MNVHIESSWKAALETEFGKEYFSTLRDFIHEEYRTQLVYPAAKNIFRAFDLTPFTEVRVVILGQDPYHGEGQATGLSFAVPEGVRPPPSLKNIFKEVADDTDVVPDLQNGDLSRWARQGVLLLNATLTVRAASAGSHQGQGWEVFTDAAIHALSDQKEHLVFILWGNYARSKGERIDRTKHLVIESAHPSPFSTYGGFFGSKPFSKTNDYLRKHGTEVIDWR